jgi:hypothetical protein
MMQTNIQQKIAKSDILLNPGQKYKTWYDFKKDLESLCGQPILNELWLQIKPKTALPWNSSNIRASYVFKKSLKYGEFDGERL